MLEDSGFWGRERIDLYHLDSPLTTEVAVLARLAGVGHDVFYPMSVCTVEWLVSSLEINMNEMKEWLLIICAREMKYIVVALIIDMVSH